MELYATCQRVNSSSEILFGSFEMLNILSFTSYLLREIIFYQSCLDVLLSFSFFPTLFVYLFEYFLRMSFFKPFKTFFTF